MASFDVPTEVVSVFEQFRAAEFTTIGKDGTPATWPITAAYHPERCKFLAATSVGLPQKAVNIRHDPRVSLLFPEPSASRLNDRPAVLVQGEAHADEELTSLDGIEDGCAKIYRFQPAAKQISWGPLTKHLMDWCSIRIPLRIVPTWILWWPQLGLHPHANDRERRCGHDHDAPDAQRSPHRAALPDQAQPGAPRDLLVPTRRDLQGSSRRRARTNPDHR